MVQSSKYYNMFKKTNNNISFSLSFVRKITKKYFVVTRNTLHCIERARTVYVRA